MRIDALYEEDFRHVTHASNGSVESNEYKDIHEHIDSIELMKRQNLEAENARREKIAQKAAAGASAPAVPSSSSRSTQPTENVEADGVNTATAVPASPMREELSSTLETGAPPPAEDSAVGQAVVGPTLEQRLADLRKQVQRRVKAPGAPLKSAPFHTAITLQLMTPGTEVLIVIATTYWYGVETHDGLHGWMQRDQLEVHNARDLAADLPDPRRSNSADHPRLHVSGARSHLFAVTAAAYGEESGNERAFPQSKSAIEKALREMQSSASGRLPVLDGFANPAGHALDRYQRGYYQSKFQVTAEPSGGATVKVTVQVTAYYVDPAGAKSALPGVAVERTPGAGLAGSAGDRLGGQNADRARAWGRQKARRKVFRVGVRRSAARVTSPPSPRPCRDSRGSR